ncbi:MAG: 16S rRNA (guanine(966)-N(2))-methyltransferase RsmD [Pseudomonadota bacterium]
MQRNTIRIIGGKWKARKVRFPDARGLRPSADRTRETLFNWLLPQLPGARCLDLFAGSGALGLEALSRGAAGVDFVEHSARVARALRDNLVTLQERAADQEPPARVEQSDAFAFLRRARGSIRYDIVLVDPPFADQLVPRVLRELTQDLLADGALVYVETAWQTPADWPPAWTVVREKRFGDARATLLALAG